MSSFTSSSKSHRVFEFESTTSSNNTNPKKKKNYNVYLSFCNEDANSFVSNLYTALISEPRIVVFCDDNNKKFENGDREIVPTSSLNAIENCEVVVIVFSKNYVNSRLCLQELEKITECCRNSDLIALPVFYNNGVYPCHGRLQRGMFGEGFHEFVDKISLDMGRKVL
ncbi:disease resistance protein RPV1-like [Cicer arietinum]|uniref:disease resistance protein RPV1-like n=1 Tax=Cicer arietinum TaxID=3827 RepID=UPI003CC5DE49